MLIRAGMTIRLSLPTAMAMVLLSAAGALAQSASPQPASPADSDVLARVRVHTARLAGYPTRALGTRGHEQAAADLLDRLKDIQAAHPCVKLWRHPYEVVVPRTLSATMRITAGASRGKHAIYPLWPASVRANTTPADGIEGRLVYVGQGKLEQLLPRSLPGQIAVMEMAGSGEWQTVANFGPSAIILLGSDSEGRQDAQAHLARLPLNMPRFYIPAGPLADALRRELAPQAEVLRKAGELPPDQATVARLDCRVEFFSCTAENYYVLVPPAKPTARSAIMLAAAYDSAGIVPDLAPGADAAVDAALLLTLLERCAANRPNQPVLFAFVDAFANNQAGVREMLIALAGADRDREIYIRADRQTRDEYEQLKRMIDELGGPERGRWNEAIGMVGQHRYSILHRYIKDEVARQVVRIENELHPLRLRIADRSQAGRDEAIARERRLDDLKQLYNAAQAQLLGDGGFNERTRPVAVELWAAVVARVEGQWRDVNARLWVHQARGELRADVARALGLPPPAEDARDVPIAFMLGLDLSDAGLVCGPRLFCSFQRLNESGNAKDFTDWLVGLEKDKPWTGSLGSAVDLSPVKNSQAVDQYSLGQPANMTSVAVSFGVPAATWGTLNAVRLLADTPQDRADRLDWRRLGPQVRATATLVERLIGSADFAPKARAALWSRTCGVVVDQSPGEPVPRVPMPGYIVTMISGYCRGGQQFFNSRTQAEGVRLDEWQLTGTDGMFFFDALPAASITADRAVYKTYTIQAYQLDAVGDIVRATDLNKVGSGVRLDVDITVRNAAPRRAVVFSCRQVTVLGLYDPRFLQSLGYGSLLDARRQGRPQRMNFSLTGGQMCALMESTPDMRWQVLLRAGTTENRMTLINVEAPESAGGKSLRETMRGFQLGRPLGRSPVELAAEDFYNLDARRIADYAAKGLRSEAIDEIHRKSGQLIARAEAARQNNDARELFGSAMHALSHELLAYQAVRDLANDVVRAAIFLLLALVPFSFAMERLLFASPHVYRQLGGTLGIFAAMTAILWSFHPAFRISSQPLMIIMAFGIIFMSLLVMSIVYQRFKAQLEELRSGRAEASGARTSRGGLAASAIRLGIANMRKRKLRTALTGATVMLITFALLCFTSVSSYSKPAERILSVNAPYTGLLIRQPQQRPMPAAALPVVESAVRDRGQIVPQYWLSNPSGPDWRLRVCNAPATQGEWERRDFAFNAAVGLSPGEELVSGIDKILARWDDFLLGNGCYIDSEAAANLLPIPLPAEMVLRDGDSQDAVARKLKAQRQWRGDIRRQRQWLAGERQAGRPPRLLVAGQELELLDVYVGKDIAALTTLTGESIMPIDYSRLGPEQRALLASQDQDLLTSEMTSGVGLAAEQQLPPLPPADVIILPASLVKRLPLSSLRSIAVAVNPDQPDGRAVAKEIAEEMADRVSFPIYYGGGGGDVRVLAATGLTPRGPKSLAIMLVIAGLIIFNTMLNSIAERRKEIHIYSSLGLAPMHIGVLFLAEAATYGLMGAIFGYVVGQGVATALAHFNLLGGVTLNYSGTQAVATMMLVLAVTVMSAIVPAYMAGKLAAPSNVMKWAVPKPQDDVIRDVLPFTVTGRTANGVAAFLHEYLDAHREGSIGHFSTDNLRLIRRQADGQDVLGVEATVWLSPYDLGVRQDVVLTISGTGEPGVLQIEVEIRRGAGQVASWWKLNRVFLGDLRKQLLGWRKLKPARVLEYIAGGNEALAAM